MNKYHQSMFFKAIWIQSQKYLVLFENFCSVILSLDPGQRRGQVGIQATPWRLIKLSEKTDHHQLRAIQ